MAGTLDAIQNDGKFHVGLAQLTPDDVAIAERFVTRLEAATGAEAEIVRAPLEVQLGRLEDGEIDLLIAELRKDTPWAKSVAVIEPLTARAVGGHVIELSPVVRNGENRWVALVEREVRDSAEARP